MLDPAIPFSIAQLEILMTWAERGPLGLSIANDHEELPEVAEFWRQDTTLPAYMAFVRTSGCVEVTELDTADRAGTYAVVADVTTGLTWVEARERDVLERSPY